MTAKQKVVTLPDGFNDWDRPKQVNHIVTEILTEKHALSPEKSILCKTILVEADKRYPSHGIPENTFNVTLSGLVRSNTSEINSVGRKKGYFLSQDLSAVQAEEKSENDDSSDEKKKKEKEIFLYRIFIEWLYTQGFSKVRDTSSARNQDLGTWGNPDITGIKIHETLGKTTDIEFVTVEVKSSSDNWKYWIFESVAHKRFSNRAYYAFACPEDMLNKIDHDLKQYAEIYGIGILVLPLSKDVYEELNRKITKFNADKLSEYSSTDVIEISSSPYFATHYHFRGRFLKAIGINSEKELHEWGQVVK